jgi:hypothetical protein
MDKSNLPTLLQKIKEFSTLNKRIPKAKSTRTGLRSGDNQTPKVSVPQASITTASRLRPRNASGKVAYTRGR